ncbi:hypothetical protein [Spirochaeta cellobiosiphila]|uniref:hypothetical protein n=1 Tax=Spirochaeta cellobiosiphila TaxID=504483 RepID=UPI0003FBE012|nr:hypothetical protein [Spirochaeta cellobiosiphila]
MDQYDGLSDHLKKNIISLDNLTIPLISFWENKEVKLKDVDDYMYRDDPRYDSVFDDLKSFFHSSNGLLVLLTDPTLYDEFVTSFGESDIEAFSPVTGPAVFILFYVLFIFILGFTSYKLKRPHLVPWFAVQGAFIFNLGFFPFIFLLSALVWTIVFYKEEKWSKVVYGVIACLFIPSLFMAKVLVILWTLIEGVSLIAYIMTLRTYKDFIKREHEIFVPVEILPSKYSFRSLFVLMALSSVSLVLCSFSQGRVEERVLANQDVDQIKMSATMLVEEYKKYSVKLKGFNTHSLHDQTWEEDLSKAKLGKFQFLEKVSQMSFAKASPFKVSYYVIYWYMILIISAFILLYRYNNKKITIFS